MQSNTAVMSKSAYTIGPGNHEYPFMFKVGNPSVISSMQLLIFYSSHSTTHATTKRARCRASRSPAVV